MAKKASTTVKLTKFEKARIIGSRALQLSMGAPYTIKISEAKLKEINYNPIEIAKLELEQNAIPMDVASKSH